jgi:hypothetical protein
VARRTPPAIKRPAELSPAQMQMGIDRLTKVLDRVRQFNPQSVTQQFDIPHVEQLRAAVEDAIVRTFGQDTVEYERYQHAAYFDNGPLLMQFQSATCTVRWLDLRVCPETSRGIAKFSDPSERFHACVLRETAAVVQRVSSRGQVALIARHDEMNRDIVAACKTEGRILKPDEISYIAREIDREIEAWRAKKAATL